MEKIKYIIGIIIIFLLDQMSKIIIMNTLSLNESVELINNFFYLTYTHNNGAAFSMFEGKTKFILLVSLLMLIYLLYELFKNKRNKKIAKLSLVMIIGGLLGNLLDRIYFGYVRDFLDFFIFGIDAAIFNVADTFIVIGGIVYFITILLEDKNGNKNNK